MNFFLDSSVLIEYVKGNKAELLEQLFSHNINLYINDIVYSEFMFHFLALVSEKSPLTLKMNSGINKVLTDFSPIDFLEGIEILPVDKSIITNSYELMKKYNLLPNDSLIVATCIGYNIENLVSYDSDFEIVSKSEKIKLIQNTSDMNFVL